MRKNVIRDAVELFVGAKYFYLKILSVTQRNDKQQTKQAILFLSLKKNRFKIC